MKTVVTSGYYNPMHRGHLALMRAVKEIYPDSQLIVIVNSDAQVKLKGSEPFMDERERIELVRACRYVDYAVLSIDADRTVLETLKRMKPDVFAKGGDSIPDNTPELAWCEENGVKVLFGIGGNKVQSSSWLKDQAKVKKCKKCIAHYTGRHTCDGLMRMLVSHHKRKKSL